MNGNIWHSDRKQTVTLAGLAIISPSFWLSFLWWLLSSSSFPLLFVPCLMRRRQDARSSAQTSHVLVLMWHVFMFLLQTSLKRRRGLPTGRVPSANSPYSRSLGDAAFVFCFSRVI